MTGKACQKESPRGGGHSERGRRESFCQKENTDYQRKGSRAAVRPRKDCRSRVRIKVDGNNAKEGVGSFRKMMRPFTLIRVPSQKTSGEGRGGAIRLLQKKKRKKKTTGSSRWKFFKGKEKVALGPRGGRLNNSFTTCLNRFKRETNARGRRGGGICLIPGKKGWDPRPGRTLLFTWRGEIILRCEAGHSKRENVEKGRQYANLAKKPSRIGGRALAWRKRSGGGSDADIVKKRSGLSTRKSANKRKGAWWEVRRGASVTRSGLLIRKGRKKKSWMFFARRGRRMRGTLEPVRRFEEYSEKSYAGDLLEKRW